jgi:alkaline phosphatase D
MTMLRRRTVSQLATAAALAAPLPVVAQRGPQSDAALTRIAFGSCADQKKPQPIWEAVLGYKPELFIFMGDNVYGDFNSRSGDKLRESYEAANGIEGYTRLRRTVPHLAIWDDHDYGKNDGGADWAHKDVAKDEFCRFFDLPGDDPRRQRDGLYDARIYGPAGRRIQVILLDIRWFKSPWKITDQRGAPGKERYLPDEDPAKTMLGEVQWKWLAEELRKPAELRVLVSSIQLLAEGHGWERWGNFPLERRRMFETIRAAKANGVITISGDRHLGALYREQPAGLYPLTEVTSSGLNQVYASAREPGPNRLGELYAAANFGSIEIEWSARVARLALHGLDGTVQRSTTIKADDLVIAT